MVYNTQQVDELYDGLYELTSTIQRVRIALIQAGKSVTPDLAREHLVYGAARRLGSALRCLRNVFDLFPPDTDVRLSSDALGDLDINLHAFQINVAGFGDN